MISMPPDAPRERELPLTLSKTLQIAGGVILVGGSIVGWVFWVANIAQQTALNQDQLTEMKARVTSIDEAQRSLASKQAVFDVKIDTILEKINELKQSVDEKQ